MTRVHTPSLLGALLLIVTTAAVADTANTLTEAEQKAGFELLFNGKDFKGWDHKGNWKVEGDAIARAGKGGGLSGCRS